MRTLAFVLLAALLPACLDETGPDTMEGDQSNVDTDTGQGDPEMTQPPKLGSDDAADVEEMFELGCVPQTSETGYARNDGC